jgi:hypothetical protein
VPIPATRTDLNAVAASNYPAGNENPIQGDDHLRVHAAFIRQNYDDILLRTVAADLADTANAAKGSALVKSNPTLNYAVQTIGAQFIDDGVNLLWFVTTDAERNAIKAGTSTTDHTALMTAALAVSSDIVLPVGRMNFGDVVISKRGTRIRGKGKRSAWVHTGSGIAIDFQDTSAGPVFPSARNAYVQDGDYYLGDLSLYVSGTTGLDLGKYRSTGTVIERVYMMPFTYYNSLTSSTYAAGKVAISCNNVVWTGASESTYGIKIRDCTISGFEDVCYLNEVVNFWQISGFYCIDNLRHINLASAPGVQPGVTGIRVHDCYFESGVAAARGVVFGSGGGNFITITDSAFEFTNVAATQYVYDFSAGGVWADINARDNKYLLQGDGGAVNSKRIIGTAPLSFIESGRSYNSAALGTLPMTWAPGTLPATPWQYPANMRFGGYQQGVGYVRLGRNDTDGADSLLSQDGSGNLGFSAYNDVLLQTGGTTPVTRWTILNGGTLQPFVDNSYAFGQASKRCSVVYSATAAINTSDENSKEQIEDIPVEWLGAWADVKWQRFKFRDAVSVKADGARWHIGLIAQKVHGVFKAHGIDALKIGLLCFDEWIDESGVKQSRYGIRYEEALALESAYIRHIIGNR